MIKLYLYEADLKNLFFRCLLAKENQLEIDKGYRSLVIETIPFFHLEEKDKIFAKLPEFLFFSPFRLYSYLDLSLHHFKEAPSMTAPNPSNVPPETLEKISQEITALSIALEKRIPDFQIQLKQIHERLAAVPELTWLLSDDQIKTIISGFKENMNLVIFSPSGKKAARHVIKGEVDENSF